MFFCKALIPFWPRHKGAEAGKNQLKKIDAAVLGATGKVGLEYLEMLEFHPWFRVVAVTGNSKVGLKMGEVAPDFSTEISSLEVKESDPSKIDADLVFSPLPT